MKRKILGLTQAVLIALVVLSGAIALPILCRFVFYWHIVPLRLAEIAGLTVAQIKTAYNEMMDFCIGLTDTFSAGVLPFSQSGAAHFADVRKLFVLDLRVLVVAGILLGATLLLGRKNPVRLGGHTPGFWSAVGMAVSFLIIGILVALDFQKAFEVFHRLFFPGKDNWLFNPWEDPIITILPAEFFRNCAIIIFAAILICSGFLLLQDRKRRK